ncbi:MAG: hypothetical protein IPM23_13660 [Candidatus Melainabacteria bacterium]|nr:hypothetical protein [Candidatus Melainabacteria bacterium]
MDRSTKTILHLLLGKSQTPQIGGDWQGTEQIISVPASKPRSMGQD